MFFTLLIFSDRIQDQNKNTLEIDFHSLMCIYVKAHVFLPLAGISLYFQARALVAYLVRNSSSSRKWF